MADQMRKFPPRWSRSATTASDRRKSCVDTCTYPAAAAAFLRADTYPHLLGLTCDDTSGAAARKRTCHGESKIPRHHGWQKHLRLKKNLNITDLEAYTMASKEAINVKFKAFESRMEEKMRSLFIEFNIGRPSSPRKSQHEETSDRRDDPQEHRHIIHDQNNPHMKVDFPRWEGDPIRWISRVKRYFRFYRTANATRVEIATIHLEGDTIQWFNWFEHTHPMEDSLGSSSRKDY
ncbi:hypothetical protein GW17_00051355 [Ensete ventricosum]|nr:hypothetical protein GW17_00051355 [Ensete ventricosum]